ncbi:hypothetical protein DESAMIL20_2029 [Desulfurella amilsii]|uniref:Uncharacterized protein n=1 Tax=Desulfurella amilsii TaxID=1562698 RepID=A0A1X4XU57_9BACT|nr:hypothetical protein [Desulfurella amilsii]OSS41091.1 hypothetical protein DESAMIL20_2029 [Desulfurella amilsii]
MKYIRLARLIAIATNFIGVLIVILAVYFKLPASNSESMLGLKAIMLMILFVVNTSSNSLHSSEFYFLNKCELENDNDIFNSIEEIYKSLSKLVLFNMLVLNSSIFLIISILANIIQSVTPPWQNIFTGISFYSFVVFIFIIINNYLFYNFILYRTFKKIVYTRK